MKQGWEIKKLGEVCEKLTDGSHNPPKGILHSDYLMLSSQNIHNDKILFDDVRFLSKDDFIKEDKRTLVREGDILITIVGTIGRCAVFTGNKTITLQRSVAVLRPQNNISSRYLMYCIIGKNSTLNEESHGIAQKGIYLKQLSQIPIPISQLAEQERIVAELDCLSGVIEKKKQQLKELDSLAQSIFYEMFGDPITNEKGWEVKKLGEVCDVRDGTHDSPKYLESSEYALITSKNITSDGEIDFNTVNYISKEDYDAINKRSYVSIGDIIMAMIGTIGKPIIVKETSRKFCIKNVALIKFGDSILVSNKYIQALLSNNSYASYIKENNKGGTQKFIALGTIRNLLTPLPPLSLQQAFASKIEAIEKQKELIKQSIKEVETLFNSRMDYYFN